MNDDEREIVDRVVQLLTSWRCREPWRGPHGSGCLCRGSGKNVKATAAAAALVALGVRMDLERAGSPCADTLDEERRP